MENQMEATIIYRDMTTITTANCQLAGTHCENHHQDQTVKSKMYLHHSQDKCSQSRSASNLKDKVLQIRTQSVSTFWCRLPRGLHLVVAGVKDGAHTLGICRDK